MSSFVCRYCGTPVEAGEVSGQTACPACQRPLAERTASALPFATLNSHAGGLDRAANTDNPAATVAVDLREVGGLLWPAQNAAGPRSVRDILLATRPGTDRYILAEELARGGMGVVHRAVDRDVRREVAVKYLLSQADPLQTAGFLEEAQITGQLEHPNIVPIHELGADADGRVFFAMKMVRGQSLAQLLDELRLASTHGRPSDVGRQYPLSRLLTVFIAVCNALAYAHARGVIHRDLKPANIMLGDFGQVYVMDWGIAKLLDHQPAGRAVATSRIGPSDAGQVVGTPAYMPPEQAEGRTEDIDERSDIYSLGAILYELLTLLPPVETIGSVVDVLIRVTEGTIVPPEERLRQAGKGHSRQVPKELAAIAMKALARDPLRRYARVEALQRDVELFLEGKSVSAKADTPGELLWKLVKRNKAVSAVTSAAAVLLVAVLGTSAVVNYRAWLKAEAARVDLVREQGEKDKRTRAAVPALVEAARLAVDRHNLDNALKQLTLALEYNREHAPAHLLKGQVHMAMLQFDLGRPELEWYLKHGLMSPEQLVRVRRLIELSDRPQPGETATLLDLALLFEQQGIPALADTLLTKHGRHAFEARQKLLTLYQQRIEKAWPGLGNRLELDGSGIFQLSVQNQTQVVNLEPLEGMPLTVLRVENCTGIQNLAPLRGMPLRGLSLGSCARISDLAPLRDAPLVWISVNNCPNIRDLSPLLGKRLEHINLMWGPVVTDLSFTKGMPLNQLLLSGCLPLDLTPLAGQQQLTEITLPEEVTRGTSVLRGMKGLAKIDGRTPEDFWQRYDKGEYPKYRP